ncbi:hypothetical protein crov181 [Cafeteria roenbergensis virus]|uniref:Uncharacterized protein n=1 Tax=Cafeteria roenbergensis virus (strain BV-PW1) TaxID=693272 RepID=E3T4V1_CROVB|nr:hypothetical protein crov181 [Cafeteria roenbergensis virus BV-PW1]ADO67214.1 hypothetical protein crov181 [Cafeteria roenbergensis virus BV-PW1]
MFTDNSTSNLCSSFVSFKNINKENTHDQVPEDTTYFKTIYNDYNGINNNNINCNINDENTSCKKKPYLNNIREHRRYTLLDKYKSINSKKNLDKSNLVYNKCNKCNKYKKN